MDIIAVVISGIALVLSLFQLITDRNRSKKEATLNAFNLIQNEVFDKVVQLNIKHFIENKKINTSDDFWK